MADNDYGRRPVLCGYGRSPISSEAGRTLHGSADREQRIKTMIAEVMRQSASLLRGHKVVLFGSRAGGRARPRSDFDIGVIGDQPLPIKDFYEIEDMLENLPTLYKIDWVDLNKAAPSLREKALSISEVIYE